MKSTVTLTPKDSVKRIAEVYGFPPDLAFKMLVGLLDSARDEAIEKLEAYVDREFYKPKKWPAPALISYCDWPKTDARSVEARL